MDAPNGIIILGPPHSYASEACAMLGRHPQLYGLPDLNLFVADTVEGWYIALTQHMKRPQYTHGLLRVLAQLHEEEQSEHAINRAWDWLSKRKTWTTQSLWSYLSKRVYPRVLLDKSPTTSRNETNMQRALAALPGANFIHLTRHPVPSTESIDALKERMQRYIASSEESPGEKDNSLLFWYRCHNSIMNFIAGLPEGQSLRLCSEQLFRDADTYLLQLVEWLGLSTRKIALDAMQHPEYSPYACLGPINAQYGDDRDFLTVPTHKPVIGEVARIEDFLSYQQAPERVKPAILHLSHQLGYR